MIQNDLSGIQDFVIGFPVFGLQNLTGVGINTESQQKCQNQKNAAL